MLYGLRDYIQWIFFIDLLARPIAYVISDISSCTNMDFSIIVF